MRLFGRRRGGDRAAPRYSNEAVIQRIQLDAGVDRDTARSWFDEMLLFLDLAADSREFISPPKPVDAAWHAFILHTRDYEAYCRERFGRIIHHEPTTSPDPEAMTTRTTKEVPETGAPVWGLTITAGPKAEATGVGAAATRAAEAPAEEAAAAAEEAARNGLLRRRD